MELSELDTLLASTKRASATVRLCLRGDLQGEWELLDEQLTGMRRKTTNTLAVEVTAEETALAERIRDLEAEMGSATIELRFEALERKRWRELLEAHPAREGNKLDAGLNLNQDTFYDALIGTCLVEPRLDPERLERLLEGLSSYQFDKLANAAWGVNRRDVEVPFSSIASHTITLSGGTSKPPPDSGSPTAGSAGGNRKKSSSTSTTKLAG